MWRGLFVVLVPLLIACPLPGADKPSASLNREAAAAGRKDWILVGRYEAELVRVNAKQRSLRLKTHVPAPPRPSSGSRRGGSSAGAVHTRTITLGDFRVADDVKIRTAVPPVHYDSKGNRKLSGPQSLRELQEASQEWGYKADFASLMPGQTVEVFLMRPGTPAQPSPRKPDTQKDKTPSELPRPIVTEIRILR